MIHTGCQDVIITGSTVTERVLGVARDSAKIRERVNLVRIQVTRIEILLALQVSQLLLLLLLVPVMAVALLLLMMMIPMGSPGAHLARLFLD